MSKSTPLYDDSPALVGGQSKLPDVVQKAIIKKKMKAVKEKKAFVLSAGVGALSTPKDGDKLRGAAGGIIGGYGAGSIGALAGLLGSYPIAKRLMQKDPLRAMEILQTGLAAGAVPAGIAGAIVGGKRLGSVQAPKKLEKKAYVGLARYRALSAHEKKKKKKKKRGLYKMAAHGAQYDDSHMLSKSLERMAAQAMHLKHKMDCGLVLPSWAEYKIYKAYDSVNSALGASYPGHYPMGMKGQMMKEGPSPMIVKAAAHCMAKHKKKKKPMMKKASAEQEIMAALTAEGGAAGMGAIKKRVSSPDLAAAMKRLMAQGKIHKHRDGDIIKK